jgi:hypothetical protein
MSVFTQLITARANQPDSSQILPVVTTQLFNQIVHFELGSADLSVITNGVSPFLMCPLGYSKATTEQALTQQYLMIHNESGSTPTLSDVQKLLAPTYNLPDSLHQQLFQGMPDVYYGAYQGLLGEYVVADAVTDKP